MRRVLADTGLFVALFNRNDQYHERCVTFMKSAPALLLTSWPVITEVSFFLSVTRKIAFLTFVKRGGVTVQEILVADLQAIIAVFQKYHDREVDLADASLIWLAEKMGVTDIATIDRQDFEIYRLTKNRCFSIVL